MPPPAPAGTRACIAERVGPTGRVIGLDQDPTMLELARPRLDGLPVTLVHANFDQLPAVLGVRRRDGSRRRARRPRVRVRPDGRGGPRA